MVEFEVDRVDYTRFEKFVESEHLTPDEALRAALTKGMEAFWPQQLASMVDSYEELGGRLEEYNRDNNLLRRIHSQNNELARLLEQPKRPARGSE